MPNNTPGLHMQYKPGSPNDIRRLMPRGLRLLIEAGAHPDDMSEPCQQWLYKHQIIAPAKQQHTWAWTKLGQQIGNEYRRRPRR